jgi:uncharacterized membrane protein YdcZ (DUF606 family)
MERETITIQRYGMSSTLADTWNGNLRSKSKAIPALKHQVIKECWGVGIMFHVLLHYLGRVVRSMLLSILRQNKNPQYHCIGGWLGSEVITDGEDRSPVPFPEMKP